MINYVFFWLAWLSYGPKNTVGAVTLAKKIYPSLSAYPTSTEYCIWPEGKMCQDWDSPRKFVTFHRKIVIMHFIQNVLAMWSSFFMFFSINTKD